MIRRCLTYFIAIIAVATALAQQPAPVTLSGSVADDTAEPVAGAMVRAYAAGRIAAHTVTGIDGRFTLRLSAGATVPDTVRLTVSGLGYESVSDTVAIIRGAAETRVAPLVLRHSSRQLREVVVRAPAASRRGDTTIFRLSAFAGKSDITLEDGLKRLPGIEVRSDGGISYLGRGISNFYVEGLQLTGSSYNRITRNLPAEYVTDVQLIENHQAARIDSGRMSEDVALNVKLNSRVKFRPVGTASAGAGLRSGTPLYSGALTGMLFNPSFQTIITLKGGNTERQGLEEASGHLSTGATGALGSLAASRPPLPESRYLSVTERMVNANAIKSFGRENTLRAGASYAYSHTSSGYLSQSLLFDGSEQPAVYEERYDPTASLHRAGVDFDLRLDGTGRLLDNSLFGQWEFERRQVSPLTDGGVRVGQTSRVRSWRITDRLSYARRKGARRWDVTADATYSLTPVARLSVGSGSTTNISGTQNARSHMAEVTASTGLSWHIGSCSRIGLPIAARWRWEHISTDWTERRSTNDLIGHNATLGLAPYYEYSSRDRRLLISATLSLKALLLRADNIASAADPARVRLAELFLSPDVKIKYDPDPRLSLSLSGRYDRKAGDMAELLTGPVMQSWRGVRMRSGHIGRTRTTSALLSLRYSNTLSLWFASLSAGAIMQTSDIMSSSDVGAGGGTTSTGVMRDSRTRSLDVSASVTKQLLQAGLKFTLGASCSWSDGESLRQGEPLRSTGYLMSAGPRISVAPWTWIELRLGSQVQRSVSRYPGTEYSDFSWTTDGRLSLYPAEGWEIYGRTEYIRKRDASTDWPDLTLLDAGASWRTGKFRFTLRADNLLNRRSYHYTVYNGPDAYRYTFSLTGRSITAGVTLTL